MIQLPCWSVLTVHSTGFNSPEWFLANMGAIACGGKAAGIYTTNGPEACQYIVEHSKSKVVVCEDKKHLAKFITLLEATQNQSSHHDQSMCVKCVLL